MTDDTSKTPGSEGSTATPGDDDNADEGAGGVVAEKEIGGRDGPDPTRYGDWEKNGRCIDF